MTCKVWILLNPSVFSSGCFWDTGWYFPLFSYFLWILIEFSQWFYSNLLLLNVPSLLAASPFYNVILGFQGTTDSPHLLSWVPEPMLCQQPWWLIPFLFLIIFSFWCLFPKSLQLTFHFRVSLKSWPLVLLPSRSLTPFQTQLLAALPLVIFPKWADSFLLGWKSSQLLPFVVLHSGFPEVLVLAHE